MNKKFIGNILAFFTVIVWGTTFVATKILLKDFSPTEILFFRFIISYFVLLIIYPKDIRLNNIKQELPFIIAGLSGITIYQFIENSALQFTNASNVSIITSTAPFATAILAPLVLKNEKFNKNFIFGFIVCLIGIILITFNGIFILELNPLGDILCVAAVIFWAIYSISTKFASKSNYNMIVVTRKITFYGTIFIIPIFFITKSKFDLSRFTDITNTLLILFLGIIASAIGFCTWNKAVKDIGAVKTSIYMYAIPIITIIFSVIFLSETLTLMGVLGTLITICGLFISNFKPHKNNINNNDNNCKEDLS